MVILNTFFFPLHKYTQNIEIVKGLVPELKASEFIKYLLCPIRRGIQNIWLRILLIAILMEHKTSIFFSFRSLNF